MRKSKVTIFWDFIRHLLILVSTVVALYFLWIRINWVLAIIVAIPVYIVMRIIFGFLTLPLYVLTPETMVCSMALKAADKGGDSSALLEAYEKGEFGHCIRAVAFFKVLIRIKPNFANAYCDLGKFYGKLGRYTEAIEALKKAIRIKPGFAEAHNNLGVIYRLLEHYKEAIESFKQAICVKPDFAEAHGNLGAVYLILGDKDSALEQYKILKEINTDLANGLFNLINE
jgi:Flp pilus assembly protein TadD